MKTHGLHGLGQQTRQELTDLVASLKTTIGDELVALLVYGSAARGEYSEGASDVDVLLVMRTAAREHLDAIANALAVARFSARIEAIILTAAEIPRSADAFPLFYDDIRHHHILLLGADPFANLEISDTHRRHRIEQELREANIRLRRAVVDALGQPTQLAAAVLRKAKQLRTPLHALLTMKGVQTTDNVADVLQAASTAYDVDGSFILAAGADPDRAHAALVALLARAIDDVDRFGDESGA